MNRSVGTPRVNSIRAVLIPRRRARELIRPSIRRKPAIKVMTPAERANPDLLNPSRKQRIAKGCGVDIGEVNRFIKQFEQTRKMMKQIPGMMKGRRGRKMFGGFNFPF